LRRQVVHSITGRVLEMMAAVGYSADHPVARRFPNIGEIDWRLVPNLAIDAIVPLLARLIGIYAAGKVFVLLIAAMTVSGTFALYRAIWGRYGAWPLTSFRFLYNQIFLYGFLNYLFAAALALPAACTVRSNGCEAVLPEGSLTTSTTWALPTCAAVGVQVNSPPLGSMAMPVGKVVRL